MHFSSGGGIDHSSHEEGLEIQFENINLNMENESNGHGGLSKSGLNN